MKRLKIENNQINFIGLWNLENDNICKNIINFLKKILIYKKMAPQEMVKILI